MKKLVILLSLIAPNFAFANLLVPGDYKQGSTKVSVEDLRDGGQLFQIKEKNHVTFRAEISADRFNVYSSCENGISNVTQMGSLIEANCNTADGERFRLFIEQDNGVVTAVYTAHEVPGMFGGGYKIKNQESIRNLELK